MSAGDPMIPPPGPSRLLALPRELRDMVYDFALTEDDSLLLVERHDHNSSTTSFKGYSNEDPIWEANRIKYVNWQLYSETKGLGLRLNELKTNSIEEIATFITTCSLYQKSQIRKVTISTDDIIPAIVFKDLSDSIIPAHCHLYPQCDVRLRLGYYHGKISGALWVWGAVLSLCAICKHTHSFVPERLRQSLMSTGIPQGTTFQFPNNIRMFPSALAEMESEAFVQTVRQLWDEDHVEYVREELRKWYRDGF